MRITTGISGLDQILHGGFLTGRVYLVHGKPGTGKTTMGLHFLSAPEGGLLISFTQAADHLRADAATLGLNLDRVHILDLTPSPEMFVQMQTYDIFPSVEVERDPISQHIAKALADSDPRRIYVDNFGHFRTLATDVFHSDRLALSFFRFATQRGATLLIGSHDRSCARDVDGVMQLSFSAEGRSLQVTKFRGSDFHAGSHDILFTRSGVQIPVKAA